MKSAFAAAVLTALAAAVIFCCQVNAEGAEAPQATAEPVVTDAALEEGPGRQPERPPLPSPAPATEMGELEPVTSPAPTGTQEPASTPASDAGAAGAPPTSPVTDLLPEESEPSASPSPAPPEGTSAPEEQKELTEAEQEETAVCADAETLRQLLLSGSTVSLSGDIEIADGSQLWEAFSPTTVRMGDFGIQIGVGADLTVKGPVRFEGSGTRVPLFHVRGSLATSAEVELAASGNGSAALWVDRSEQAGVSGYTGDWNPDLTSVSAQGDNAAALRLTGSESYELGRVRLTAGGRNSHAVSADGDVRLTLCSVASGGRLVETEGEAVLDACRISGDASGARVISRKPQFTRQFLKAGFTLPAGASEEKMNLLGLYDGHEIFAVLSDTEGREPDLPCYLPVRWEKLPGDLSTPGAYTILCLPGRTAEWWPVDWTALEIPFRLLDPSLPAIQTVTALGASAIYISFLSELADADRVELYVSDDHGESWTDSRKYSDTSITPSGAVIAPLDQGRDYLLRLEVWGGERAGRSEPYPYYCFTEDPNREGGGDRDYDDRGDQGAEPPHGEIIPPETPRRKPAGQPPRIPVLIWAGGGEAEPKAQSAAEPPALPEAEELPAPAPVGQPDQPQAETAAPAAVLSGDAPGTAEDQPSTAAEPGIPKLAAFRRAPRAARPERRTVPQAGLLQQEHTEKQPEKQPEANHRAYTDMELTASAAEPSGPEEAKRDQSPSGVENHRRLVLWPVLLAVLLAAGLICLRRRRGERR